VRASAVQQPRELRYEFGFRSPRGDLVVCSSLQEAQFFAESGAKLMLREIETRVGEWKEAS
jgi:hypothetical protein